MPELRRVQSVQSVDDVGAPEKKANPQFRSSPKSSPACICIYRILQMQRDRSAESELPELCVLSDAGGQWWNVYQLNPRFMGHKCGQKTSKSILTSSHFVSRSGELSRHHRWFRLQVGNLQHPHAPTLPHWLTEFSSVRLHPQWDGGDWIAPRSDFGEGLYGAVDATGSLREPNSVVKLDMQRRENGWLSIYRWITIDPNRSQWIPLYRSQ